MFFTDYYAPGMSPEASYAGMQMPQMYSGAPTDKNFARPAAPAPGMAAGAEESNAPAQTDKAPGMAREAACHSCTITRRTRTTRDTCTEATRSHWERERSVDAR